MDYDFEKAWKLVQGLNGGCDRAEGEWWLHELLIGLEEREVDPRGKLIVEIGALDGGGTVLLAWAARLLGARVLSVDLHGTEDPPTGYANRQWWCARRKGFYGLKVWANSVVVSGLKEYIMGVIDDSVRAASLFAGRDILFLHVDGCHEGVAAYDDFCAWKDGVVVGGIVAFHDAGDRDVSGCIGALEEGGLLDDYEELVLPELRDVEPISPWNVGWRTRGFLRVK